jgi:hypothetical protein
MNKTISEEKPKEFRKTITFKQWNKIRNKKNEYPSLITLKKEVLAKETKVARNFSDLKTALKKRKGLGNSQLEFDLEWFLTWRIKMVSYKTCLWCDGVEILELKQVKNFEFFISSEIWLGPESNVSKEYRCKMIGTFFLNKTFDKLKSYSLKIDYRNNKIFVLK